jgi:DNA-binding CsgD family transcriptional regulator
MLKETIDPHLWRPLFDAVYEMNTARDHADFMAAVLSGMGRLIPSDLCVIQVLQRTDQRLVFRTAPENPYSAEEVAPYVANSHDHPLVAHYEATDDSKARRISDVTEVKRWLESPFYLRTNGRLGLKHILALPYAVDAHTVAGLTFNRRRTDFTLRHCALLDSFAPHFRLAWQRHPDPWAESRPAKPPIRHRLQKLGLSPREAEVLYWMMEGKVNREIATILGLGLATVQDHVANILRKLGQENRHAATVYALRELEAA